MVVESTNPKVPHFNAPIYLENKVRYLSPQFNLFSLPPQLLTQTPDSSRQGRRGPRPYKPSLLHHQALRGHPGDLVQVRRQVLHCRREATTPRAVPPQAEASSGICQQGQEAQPRRRSPWRTRWSRRFLARRPWWRRQGWLWRVKRRQWFRCAAGRQGWLLTGRWWPRRWRFRRWSGRRRPGQVLDGCTRLQDSHYRRWVRVLYHYGAPRSAERVSVSALSGATMSGRGCHGDLDWLHRRFWKGLGHLLLYFLVKIWATVGCVHIQIVAGLNRGCRLSL